MKLSANTLPASGVVRHTAPAHAQKTQSVNRPSMPVTADFEEFTARAERPKAKIPQTPIPVRLPLTSQSTRRLQQAIHNPKPTPNLLSNVVLRDPVLAFDLLLQIGRPLDAHSSLRQTLQTTLDYLGPQLLSTYALAHSSHPNEHDSDLQTLATHSLAVARLAQALAYDSQLCDPDEAYLAGLWHNLGQFYKLKTRPNYPGPTIGPHEAALAADERKLYGLDHATLSARLIANWNNVPLLICEAIEVHHATLSFVEQLPPLARILRAAIELLSGSEHATYVAAELTQLDLTALATRLEQVLACEKDEAWEDPNPTLIPQSTLDMSLAALIHASFSSHPSEDFHNRLVIACALLCGRGMPYLFKATRNNELEPYNAAAHVLIDNGLPLPHKFPDNIAARALTTEQSQIARIGKQVSANDWLLSRLLHSSTLECVPWKTAHAHGVAIFSIASHQAANHEFPEAETPLLNILLNQALSAYEQTHTLISALNHSDVAAQEAFAASARRVAHEINNPLSVISNYLYVIEEREDVDPVLRTQVAQMQAELERAKRLLDSLTHPSSQASPAHPDVNTIIRSIQTLYGANLFTPRNITFEVQLEEPLPPIKMPADAVKQIILNLLLNAAQAIDRDGHVEVQTAGAHNLNGVACVEVYIADDGPGMTLTNDHMLEFPHASSKAEHSGVGLSIIQELVQQHNAHLLCHSRPGMGTQFQLFLPLANNETHFDQTSAVL